jgi:D-aspartate ligase
MTSTNHSFSGKPGAIVLGGDYQGLGIVRSLGRKGVLVGVVDDEISIARYSRYSAFAQQISSLADPVHLIPALTDLGKKLGLHGWVIYPTRDETVAALSQHREELGKIFRVPTPAWNSIRWLWDKRNTYKLADELGIPIPRTWYVTCAKDLEQIEGHFPVAIKPAIKEHFIYATKAKAWRADNLAQLRQLFESAVQFMPSDEVMIQDIVPGDGASQYAYCSLFKQGASLASMVTCRRRQHPLEFGRASTYVESVENSLLEEMSNLFLRSIDYYGLVEVEYKRDSRDGRYRLLDVNGRTWGYHTLGRAAGVDFPYLLFTDQMNEPVEPARGKARMRWIRLLTDLPTGLVGILQGKVESGPYFRSLWEFDEEAVFSREDPVPGIVEVALIPYLSIRRGF